MSGRHASDQVLVRWKQGRQWRQGYLDTTDGLIGTVGVIDATTGAIELVPSNALQHQIVGPRGGRRWESIKPSGSNRKATADKAFCEQLGLFGAAA